MSAGRLAYLYQKGISKLVAWQEFAERTDGQLLQSFAEQADDLALRTLMRRHGPMVLGVCRRLLADPGAVADAFQATFLVLIRRAGTLDRRGSLGAWLHEVAWRVAIKARSQSARRGEREMQVPDISFGLAPHPTEATGLRELLDDELHRLPDKLRAPLILCCLEGKTNQASAQELGLPLRTMNRHLARAKDLLRERLTCRGVVVTGAMFAFLPGGFAGAASVPSALERSTFQAARALWGGETAAGVVSDQALLLAESALNAMQVARLKTAASWLIAVTLVAVTGGAVAYYSISAKNKHGDVPSPTIQAPDGGQEREVIVFYSSGGIGSDVKFLASRPGGPEPIIVQARTPEELESLKSFIRDNPRCTPEKFRKAKFLVIRSSPSSP